VFFEVSTTPSANSSVGITLDGVKVLRDEMQRYNHNHPSSRIEKTRDIANQIVKPATSGLAEGKQAYVFLNNSKHRGTSRCFVSHAWQAVGLLDAVIKHGDTVVAKGGKPPVYDIDLATYDQHQTDQVSPPRSTCYSLPAFACLPAYCPRDFLRVSDFLTLPRAHTPF
jgi:hypothetical protein